MLQTRQHRQHNPLETLRNQLDTVEPCAHDRVSASSSIVHNGDRQVKPSPLVSTEARFSAIELGSYGTTTMIDKIEITLRPATIADLPLLQHWDEQPHVVASDPNDDWGWETELGHDPDWREQWIAEIAGRPIGFLQIIDPAREESHYWGDISANLRAIDIWIGEAADLGKGYGTAMMQIAIARCFANPSVTAILVDPLASNTRAHRFYERLGFQFVEHRRFGEDDCFVYRLDRATSPNL